MLNVVSNRYNFLCKFLQSPSQIGSVTPSSSFLTRKMFAHVNWQEVDTIVELGAGTGVFTAYIQQHKKPETKVVVIEKDDDMRGLLQQAYPSFHFGADAEALDGIIERLQINKVDCIISGLPFANFTPATRRKIMQALVCSLKSGGRFIAFQYSLQMKEMLKEYFQEVTIGFVPLNFPPAFLYTCQQQTKQGDAVL